MNTTKLTTAIELTNAAKNGVSLSELLYKNPDLSSDIRSILDQLAIKGNDLDSRWEALIKDIKQAGVKWMKRVLLNWLSSLIYVVIGGDSDDHDEDLQNAVELKYQELKAERSAA